VEREHNPCSAPILSGYQTSEWLRLQNASARSITVSGLQFVVNSVTAAEKIVNSLLEMDTLIRACAACDQEAGIQRRPEEASHGSCRRHAIQSWSQMMSPEEAAKKVNAMPSEYFVPDTKHAA
jgi:hypothetical protein